LFNARALVLVALIALTIFSVLPTSIAQAADLLIEKPWARASIGISRPAAVYLTIQNNGVETDILTMVKTPVAEMSEVHKSEVKDGIARMSPAGQVEIAAGSSINLEPGGLHIMLMKLKQPVKKGDSISMILLFENAGPIDVVVPVYGIGASGPNSTD